MAWKIANIKIKGKKFFSVVMGHQEKINNAFLILLPFLFKMDKVELREAAWKSFEVKSLMPHHNPSMVR